MTAQPCTARSREIGFRLRAAIKQAGYHTQGQVADDLGRHESEVSRLLSGQRAGRLTDVAGLLGLCRVTGADRDFVFELCEPGDELRLAGVDLWSRYREHVVLADHVVEVAAVVLPVAVQTPAYARAVVESAGVGSEDADREVQARLSTDVLYESPYRHVRLLIAEHVLRTPVGGPGVMADQLERLASLAGRSWVSVRVVPTCVGAHPGLWGGFTLAAFPSFPPMVARQDYAAMVLRDAPLEVAAYWRAVDRLVELAWGVQRSAELIRSLAVEWRAGSTPTEALPADVSPAEAMPVGVMPLA